MQGFLRGSDSKESACNAGDLYLIPGLGRSPGEGKGYLLQYSGLENSTDRGACQATVHGLQSRTQLSDYLCYVQDDAKVRNTWSPSTHQELTACFKSSKAVIDASTV